jgi:hypothetical protein
MGTSESVIAVVSERNLSGAVVERAMARARERQAPLILFDVDARTSILESPLPTDWSGEGEEQLYGKRLGPRELEMAGRKSLAREVIRSRGAGVQTYAWLPDNPDAASLADYAREQHAGLVVLSAGQEPLTTDLGVPTEVVETA